MTSPADDLRGSMPVYSAKDILVGLDAKVDLISNQLVVLVSQDLGTRVTSLEKFQNRLTGLTYLGPALALLAILFQIFGMPAPLESL